MALERRREITYEEQARIKYRRVRALDQFRIIAWVLLNCSLLSVAVGIVILVVGQNVDSFPIRVGSPIWSAFVVLVVCVFAFVISCYNPHFFNEGDSKKLKQWLLAYTITACIAIGVCLLSFSFTVYGTYRCANLKNKYGQLILLCGTNYDVQIIMHIAACLLSIFLIFFLIYGIILYFVYKDVYQFFDWEIGYHNEYLYTFPTETRIIDNNPRYAISDRSPIVEKVHYVSAEKPYAIEDTKYNRTVKQNDNLQPADIVSEYNTSNHKYLVLRFDRNQIRPM